MEILGVKNAKFLSSRGGNLTHIYDIIEPVKKREKQSFSNPTNPGVITRLGPTAR
jgi:hypothetical protein